MHFILIGVLVLLIVFGPQIWARFTFKRYSRPLNRIPGTGGELAKHLLKHYGLDQVKVELAAPDADHYDPNDRAVRLSPANYEGRSLTAVAVAAHEVGHAMQHHRGERMLALRSRLVGFASIAQRVGAGAMVLMPVVALITRIPASGLLMFVIGLLSMGSAAVVHLVTLPVEIDASFGKALPVLKAGNYIEAEDEKAIRRVLRAAAFTYVASSLAALLNLARWVALLRRA